MLAYITDLYFGWYVKATLRDKDKEFYMSIWENLEWSKCNQDKVLADHDYF